MKPSPSALQYVQGHIKATLACNLMDFELEDAEMPLRWLHCAVLQPCVSDLHLRSLQDICMGCIA